MQRQKGSGITERFLNAIALLPARWCEKLSGIEPEIMKRVSEVRFRCGSPVALCAGTDVFYCTASGRLTCSFGKDLPTVGEEELGEIVFALSRRSLHTYQDMIAKGFIPLHDGCKAGVAGTAVMKNGSVYSVSRFHSVNIRIARDFPGCADELIGKIGSCDSFLIVGQPMSGKTTLLRELCRFYSGESTLSPKKVALIDERDEIASRSFGSGLFVGAHTDVLSLYPKPVGMEIALRMLSPDIIVLDEIGASDEANAIISSANGGVGIIATAHGAGLPDVLRRPDIKRMINSKVFKKVAVLNGKESPCSVKEVITL